MATAKIGSIISGTLREEDLIPVLADELRRLRRRGDQYTKGLLEDVRRWSSRRRPQEDEGAGLVNKLIDALNEYAPPYCYFGSNPGDGADFGFWVDHDLVEMAIRDGEIFATEGERPEYILQTNDHGNMTLYRITVEEVWSVV